MQLHELFCRKLDHSVCLALIIAELNFVDVRDPNLHDRANLTTN